MTPRRCKARSAHPCRARTTRSRPRTRTTARPPRTPPTRTTRTTKGLVVLCASDDTWDNGGVECDWDYDYDSLGYGFAMSNGEDEVILTKPNGTELDRVVWRDAEWAAVGASMGVDPDSMSPSANDELDDWCDQWGFLSGGDDGSPGEENDWCW